MARYIERFVPNKIVRRGTAAVALLTLTGCETFNQQPQSTEAPTIPPMTAPPTTTILAPGTTVTTVPECVFNHDTSGLARRLENGAPQLQPELYVSEIRTGDHDNPGECFERVVFEFASPNGVVVPESGWPGVTVEYITQPVEDPSGNPLTVQGNAYLQMHTGSWLYGIGGGQGPMRITNPELENIREIAVSSNFEGYSTYVIGMNEQAPFAFGQLSEAGSCESLCYYIDVYDNPHN